MDNHSSQSDFSLNQSATVDLVTKPMAEMLRNQTAAQRLAIAFGLWRFTRSTLRRRLATNHPDWTHEQVCREAARRMLHDT